ncbi:MAG: ABC transporter ATP-binding protein [Chloroflexota bacterium]|nr:ABC transporter ATP-binding protein [Chloroflexota bacterium]
MNSDILQVKDLHVHYDTYSGVVKAVGGVDFSVRAGEKLGLVGESGCGKSSTVLALLRMIKPPGRIVAGQVLLDGVDLLRLSDEEMRLARFAAISLIPQGAMNSLNPVMRIREQMADTMRAHNGGRPKRELQDRVRELLQWVGLSDWVANMFPHELSGGMKQRVCIAMAISLKPKVVIADEPTSALDVVVQRRVMHTLERVQQELGASVILAGHDMGLMAQFVDRLGVMYAGLLVELGATEGVFEEPLHPYARLLIDTLPSLDRKGDFKGIPGVAPSLLSLPPGCAFQPRCPHAFDRCSVDEPAWQEARPGRWVACHLWTEGRG